MTPPRRSPLADWHEAHATGWQVLESMSLPTGYERRLPADAPITLRDVSWQRRLGLKGPGAAQWLGAQSLVVPQPANSWSLDARGILVARLATSEFLVEALSPAQERIEQLRAQLPATGVYPVIRQDAAFVIGGKYARELLLQTCSFNFGAPALATASTTSGVAVLTSMVGVGVTVIPLRVGDQSHYLVWCDPSFGLYLWSTLVGIAAETGGGAIAGRGS